MPQPLRLSAELPDLFARHGVRFAHWKSNHHLDAALAGETDIDLLIGAADEAPFCSAMGEAGAVKIESQPWASYPLVDDWLLADSETGGFLHLHVHRVLATGLKRVKHLYLPWTRQMLSHLRTAPGTSWPIPEAEFELLVLMVRIWAKMPPWRRWVRPRVPRHILAEVHWLQSQADAAKLRLIATELGLEAGPLALEGDEVRVLQAARALYGQTRKFYRMSWPAALLRAVALNFRFLTSRLWLKWIGPRRYRKVLAGRGAMVALIGSDGSGKSTLSAALHTWLRYKLDVHLLYMGSGDGAAGGINRVRKLLSARWQRRSPGTARASREGDTGPKSFAFKAYRLFDLMLLRRKLKYLRLGRRLAEQGSVILLDRYPQSQFDGISDGPRQQLGKGFAWAARVEQRLLAEAAALGPDMVIKLHIDAETAFRRKPDHDKKVIARKCEIVDALDFSGAETVTIDAALQPDRVALTAKMAIWSLLQKVNADGR